MVVPLFVGVILNTFFPSVLNIGGLTTSLARGSGALIGAFLLCMGAGINFKSTAMALKKGIAVTFAKFLVGALLGITVAKLLGGEEWNDHHAARNFIDSSFQLHFRFIPIGSLHNSEQVRTTKYRTPGKEYRQGGLTILHGDQNPHLLSYNLFAALCDRPFETLGVHV